MFGVAILGGLLLEGFDVGTEYEILRLNDPGHGCVDLGGEGLGWFAWRLMPKRRRIVAKNLEIVEAWCALRGQSLDIEGDPTRAVIRRTGANLLSGFGFAVMNLEQMESRAQVDGLHLLEAAVAQEKGVILLLTHMGPWELLNAMSLVARARGINAPFGSIYRPIDNQYLDRWIRAQREAQGTRLISRKDRGVHAPAGFLRQGGVLGILADQRTGRGELVPLHLKASSATF